MINELAQKWIDELRSGNREQTSGVLRRDNSFCCLGVLCDVIDPSGWRGRYELDRYGHDDIDDDEFGYRTQNPVIGITMYHGAGLTIKPITVHKGMPPLKFMRAVGMDEQDAKELADMNDLGESFSKIADRIEELLRAK